MMRCRSHRLDQLFAGEHDCIGYLFKKRWPHGFCCPFCGVMQKETAPALSVVCGNCRKQTSITARTILHGTRKSLVSWVRVAWLFCCNEQGISAREIQHIMELSSYQSAWNWLHKLRQAVSVAESAPCCGIVQVDCLPFSKTVTTREDVVMVGVALELDETMEKAMRLRFSVLNPLQTDGEHTQEAICFANTIARMVAADTPLLLPRKAALWADHLADNYPCTRSTAGQDVHPQEYVMELEQWLAQLYRRTIESKYLQGYIDEFTFRRNRQSYQDRLQIFDELLTALVTPRQGSTRLQITAEESWGLSP